MNYKLTQHSNSGFSILMAIGTIGVLLIIVTSLSLSYIRESKLSRYSYDGVITDAVAEGQFEYAMLKIRNHRDGFQDSVTSADMDSGVLMLATLRSQGLQSGYEIVASSTGHTFSLSGGQHLIIPIFSGTGTFLPSSIFSKDPNYNTGVENTLGFTVTNIGNLDWTIVAMSGSESIALTGNGDIGSATNGKIRIKASQCYSGTGSNAGDIIDCSTLNFANGDEELFYTYDLDAPVSDFITTKKDPYFIIYNSGSTVISPTLSGSTAFTLPITTVRSTARKGESSQIYEFLEDKSKYYDALKYGVYNTGP